MKKTWLEVYALTVCLFTMACLSITAGIAIYQVVRIIDPEFTMNEYVYNRFQSNTNYCTNTPLAQETCKVKKDVDITAIRQTEKAMAIDQERHSAKQNLVSELIIILVSSIVFFTHWRIARSARS